MKKQTQILSKVKSRVAKTTHKLGLKLPYCVEEAYIIDLKNGNSAFWWEAIRKGMRNVMVSFDILNDNGKILKVYQSLEVYLFLNIKMDLT